MTKRLVSVRSEHKRSGFNTKALTVIADQVADTDAFMHCIMLLTLDRNNTLVESFVHSSNKAVFGFFRSFYTGSKDLMLRLERDFSLQ